MIKQIQIVSFSFFFIFLSSCLDFRASEQEKIPSQARLKTTKGDIVIDFRADLAPISVARIQKLIKEGFYDGLSFHRVVPNYIIQTGDPSLSVRGGSGVHLKPEFSSEKHLEGTVSLARLLTDSHSADSQFFITLQEASELDGKYTIIGKVSSGLEVAKKIREGDKILFATLQN